LTNKLLTFDNVLYIQQSVKKWNEIFGIYEGDSKFSPLYQQLSYEECFKGGELLDSLEKGDKVGVLDALGDLSFTVFQWALCEGQPLELTERSGYDKVVVPNPCKTLYLKRLKDAILNKDSFGAATNLIHLLYSYSYEFDIVGAFNVILESNTSKALLKSKCVDIQKEIDYITSQGRYRDVVVEESGEYYVFKAGRDLRDGVVFDKPKVVKHSQFKDVSGLEHFIY